MEFTSKTCLTRSGCQVLYESFIQAASPFNQNRNQVEKLWAEIARCYASKGRYYHNFTHLENLLQTLTEVQNALIDYPTIVFSICYHDIVYNTLRSDNEEKSAQLAKKRLTSIGYPASKIDTCTAQILATRHHEPSENSDTNFFTDADLSILGAPDDQYVQYCQQIRKEYALYLDLLYKPGRRKVIEHFLSMEKIFKTDIFRNRFENQARKNLFQELQNLS